MVADYTEGSAKMKIDGNLTIGNIMTIFAMLADIAIFNISLSYNAAANRDDIVELKQSMNSNVIELRQSLNSNVSELKTSMKELQQSIKELQMTVNSIDKRTAILEERSNNRSPLVSW
jgi:uncharacterized protein YlxW (UPF0749 family)